MIRIDDEKEVLITGVRPHKIIEIYMKRRGEQYEPDSEDIDKYKLFTLNYYPIHELILFVNSEKLSEIGVNIRYGRRTIQDRDDKMFGVNVVLLNDIVQEGVNEANKE